ncbi:MAG: hypothetical protein KI785_02810 [Devosiaceae bacterium]|nr:hypothetical protein [Devosiaceae bacterium MH13]
MIVLAAATGLAACSPRGDFGRDRPSVMTSSVLPVAGFVSTYSAREPVSHFNYTDDERTLRRLGWTLVVPTHAEDWLGSTAAHLQRAEIIRRADLVLSPESYHRYLSRRDYRSSDVRYARIMDDAAKDMAAIERYFAYAQRVRAADDERSRATMALPDITPSELAAANGRIAENQRQFAWVKRALLFRIYAYRYALDRLMIETPSANTQLAIARVDTLEAEVLAALEIDAAFAAGLDQPIRSSQQPVDLMEIVSKG